MSVKNLVKTIRELKALEAEASELAAQIETIKDTIKAEMTAREVDTMQADVFKITWKEVISKRVDTTSLKKELPDIAQRFTVESISRPFRVTA